MSPTPKPGNNLKHGFRSSTVLLPGDDPAEYQTLHAKLTRHFRPTDLTEDRLVREMADSEWRLRRVREHMKSALTRQIEKLAADTPDVSPFDLQSRAIETLAGTGCSYSTWLRYESKFENQYERSYRAWTRYQEQRRRASAREADIAMKQAIAAPMPNVQTATAQQPAATGQVPRSAPCPCGSGDKYKRCCGRNAPAVLGATARAA